MSPAEHPVDQDARARRNVLVLAAASAFLGSQMPIAIIMAGLVGLQLAPHPCLATLGATVIVFGAMTSAPVISSLMQKYGRKPVFLLIALVAMAGALTAALGVLSASFPIFLAGCYMTGVYQSGQGFYRFAAADTASEVYRPKAISYVLAGGLVSAIVGPQLLKQTIEAFGMLYVGAYLASAAINALGIWLFLLLDIPIPPKASTDDGTRARTVGELLRTPEIAVAVTCAMVSYALMVLMMTSAPLAIVGCGLTTANAADVVSAHVLAMFAPSFFTGHLIARFGARTIVATGLVLLLAAGAVGLAGVDLVSFFGALVLLGLGWNFGFIGATSMLTDAHAAHERGRVQGMNDLIVFGGVVVASLASGGLMNCAGANPVAGWSAVALAMLPFLALAGSALIWLSLRRPAAV